MGDERTSLQAGHRDTHRSDTDEQPKVENLASDPACYRPREPEPLPRRPAIIRSMAGRVWRPAVNLDRESFHAWVQAVLWFGLGDLATSWIGIHTNLARESVPIIAAAIADFGLAVMLPFKLLGFVIALAGWKLAPQPYALGIPICLAIVGIYLTGWNAYVILSVLGVV